MLHRHAVSHAELPRLDLLRSFEAAARTLSFTLAARELSLTQSAVSRQIQAMEERSGARVVKALVPLSEMFGYVGDLRSKTQGRASYSMQFDSYAQVPNNVALEIIAKARGE